MTARTALWLLLTLLVACTPAGERASEARAKARAALERGDRPAALAALRDIEPHEEAPAALLEHAELLVGAAETPQAVWLLESSLRRHPGRSDLQLALARLQLAVDNPSAARLAAQAIPAGTPEHPSALLLVAQAELALGSLDRALDVLKEAERQYPERPEARLVRVGVLTTERRFDEARALLDETKRTLGSGEVSKETRAALRGLDLALYAAQAEAGPSEETLAGLRALVAEEPGDPTAQRALALALWRTRRPREGVEGVEQAIADDPERLALYPLAAALRASLGEAAEAERWLRQLVERSPTPSSYEQLARLLGASDPARAEEIYAEGVAALPEDATLARLHAESLIVTGRLPEAHEETERLGDLAPDDPHVEYLGARLALAEGDARGAASRLEKLVPELDQAYTQYWLATALEASGDRTGAERRYALAVQRNPTDPALYAPLIRLAQLRGDWSEAAATARLLVQRAPGVPEGWSALCSALVNAGAGEEAEKASRAFVKLFPERVDAALFVARALRLRGEHAPALDELAAVEQRLGPSAELEAERALTLGLAGRVEEGIASARTALSTQEDSALLHATLASLLFRAGQGEEGSREVDRALALDPDEPDPLRTRAEFHASTGRFEEARRDAERYLEARPDAGKVHFILGYAHERAGRRDAAVAAYRRAAELDPRSFEPRNNLAMLLADTDLEAALAAAQEAYALAPSNPAILDTLGWLYFRAGRVDRSISLLEDAHRTAPSDAETELHLALAYREAGRHDDARRLLLALSERDDGPGGLHSRVEEALRSLP